jgi:hypothetical protein
LYELSSQRSIAPFLLDTYESAKVMRAEALEAVKRRRMSPFPIDGSGRCQKFDTSARATTTTWGEGTEDEMCLTVMSVTIPGKSRF